MSLCRCIFLREREREEGGRAGERELVIGVWSELGVSIPRQQVQLSQGNLERVGEN